MDLQVITYHSNSNKYYLLYTISHSLSYFTHKKDKSYWISGRLYCTFVEKISWGQELPLSQVSEGHLVGNTVQSEDPLLHVYHDNIVKTIVNFDLFHKLSMYN